ncbi:MAG TPA: hypothetical protein VFW75_05995 [Acetobacteraceae bacterium]|nr:hypothetical protein [Acetobacteraceae bacterium]
MARLTVAVDFDGVLHSYTSPWISAEIIPDPPVPGAIEWLNALVKEFTVYIHTTRADTVAGSLAVAHWLFESGYDGPPLEVTNQKRPAVIYVDDRGWRFTGANFPTPTEIRNAKPWNKS